jgi:hypothetical protein
VRYRAMLDAAAFALKNPKFCGADTVGFTSVLHTFGRDMNYHPHVHVIIPGGGMCDGEWKSTRLGFFVPVKLLSKLFRTEFERLLREQLRNVVLPPARDFRREFVSDVEAVGDGVATLKYLSRYVFRTAITNDRILSMKDSQVTFSYRRSGEQRDRMMTLPAFEFLRRFLQHVLPPRLQKIRHYGFLSRRSNIDLDDVRDAILESLKDVEPELELEAWTVPSLRPASHSGEDDRPRCPSCGGPLVFERFHRFRPPLLTHASRPYGTRSPAFTAHEDNRQSNVTRF